MKSYLTEDLGIAPERLARLDVLKLAEIPPVLFPFGENPAAVQGDLAAGCRTREEKP